MTIAIQHPQKIADRTLTVQGGWDKFRLIQSAETDLGGAVRSFNTYIFEW